MCLNAAAGDVVSAVTALLTARSKGESERDLNNRAANVREISLDLGTNLMF